MGESSSSEEKSTYPQGAYKTTCEQCDEVISMSYTYCPWCRGEQ